MFKVSKITFRNDNSDKITLFVSYLHINIHNEPPIVASVNINSVSSHILLLELFPGIDDRRLYARVTNMEMQKIVEYTYRGMKIMHQKPFEFN